PGRARARPVARSCAPPSPGAPAPGGAWARSGRRGRTMHGPAPAYTVPPRPRSPTPLPPAVPLGALAALPAPPRAQTPCVGGTAGTYPCENVDLLAHVPRATFASGDNAAVWGWTDPLTGREYAIVGNETGTGFVDVTEPTAPVYLGKMPTET